MSSTVDYSNVESLVEAAPIPMAVVDSDSRVRLWNRAAENTFGWSKIAMLGQTYTLGHSAPNLVLRNCMEALQDGRQAAECTTTHASESGTNIPVRLVATPIKHDQNDSDGLLLMLQPILESKRSEDLPQRVEAILARHSRLDEVVPALLSDISLHLGFTFASFWLADLRGAHIRCVAAWEHATCSEEQLKERMLGHILKSNEGLAGRAHHAKVVVVGVVSRNLDDPRVHMLAKAKLEAGIAVPICVGKHNVAVAEFFGEENISSGALQEFEVVAQQIAAFIERERAETLFRDSERLFRTVFKKAGTGIALADMRGNLLVTNPALQKMLGYSEEELDGVNFEAITYPDDLPRDKELLGALISGRQTAYSMEKRYVRKDKSVVWGRLTVTLVREDPMFFICLVENLEATREIMHALRQSEARYRLLIEGSEEVFFYQHGKDGRFIYVSPSVRNVLGYEPEDLVGLHYCDIVRDPESKLTIAGTTEEAFRDFVRKPPYTAACVHKDGREIVLEITESPIRMQDGTVVMHGFARDVTARKRIEQKLQLSDLVLQNVDALITVANGRGEMTYLNPAACATVGYPIEELLGVGWWFAINDDRQAALEASLRVAARARGESPIVEEPILECLRTRDGAPRWILWRENKGPGDLLIRAGQDITNWKKAEAARERSELELRTIFETAMDGILLLDEQGRYVDANPAALAILGEPRDEIINRQLGTKCRWGIDILAAWRELAGGRSDRGETTIERRDGSICDVEYAVKTQILPGLDILLIRNITEHKKLETQLRQSQKMEAVGRLAGGVAHDFNNMLMVIRGYSELMQERASADPVLSRYLTSIISAADRAALITQQLLAFSRRQVIQPRLISLNTVVEEMARLLHRVIGEDIALRLQLSDELYSINADPGQVGQIILNLAVNARDAMPSGGTVSILTKNAFVDGMTVAGGVVITKGEYAVLAVSDSGCGMDRETQSHIFEPFFTTKPQGKGTGLGLATVYGIVKQSGGWIDVSSEVGQGTTFTIYFPRVNRGPS